MPHDDESVAASADRKRNAGRPPCWRCSGRMSGVFGQRLTSMKSAVGGWVSSLKYSSISCLKFRQVKYEYDWSNPTFASAFIIFGRVNASARKMASGWRAFTSPMTHSQNGIGLVWGLSTRKMRTPCSIQWKKTERSSAQSDSRAGPIQSKLTMSSYRLGGFSAVLMVPSGRRWNHSGCSFAYG